MTVDDCDISYSFIACFRMSIILKQFLSKAGYHEDQEPEPQVFKEKCSTMNQYRKQNHLCDVMLVVGEREFPAHRAILSASSRFFEGLFASQMKETTEKMVGSHFSDLIDNFHSI